MQVPDAGVYAVLPLMTGAAVWGLTQFVRQVVGPKGDTGPRGKPGADAPALTVKEIAEVIREELKGDAQRLTVRDYKEFAEVLRAELNGRYMMAGEARERFAAIEEKLDAHASESREWRRGRNDGDLT